MANATDLGWCPQEGNGNHVGSSRRGHVILATDRVTA